MNTRKAVSVLSAAVVLGLGVGSGAHAASRHMDHDASSASTPSAHASTPQKALGDADLVQDSDLADLGFKAVSGQGTRGEGEMQYSLSPCLTKSLSGITGGNAFSFDAYNKDGRFIGETASVAYNEPQAIGAEKKLNAAHHKSTCSDFTVRRTDHWAKGDVSVTMYRLSSDENGTQDVSIIRNGTRLALLNSGAPDDVDPAALADRATTRLG